MPIDSVATFVRQIEQLELLDPNQRLELARLATTQTDVRAFARELLQRNWLTSYQINKIMQDSGPTLLLGSYVLLERLGTGGMGEVYRAKHRRMGHIRALKFIKAARQENETAIKRFRREIEITSQLDHPNIVRAYDAEEEVGTQFLVMEYVDGIDLGRLVREKGALPIPQACDCVRQAALGLQYAYEKGFVHRDIKPANLLLTGKGGTGEGTVKILDMGLARIQQSTIDITAASANVTQAGVLVGTVEYLAPEQAKDPRTVDIRADLYSLGCTFYYLLTGQVVFAGESMTNKILKHALEEPTPVEKLRRDIPRPVGDMVRKLMAKKPENRYQTPQEVADVLAAYLNRNPHTAAAAAPARRSRAEIPAGPTVADQRLQPDAPKAQPQAKMSRPVPPAPKKVTRAVPTVPNSQKLLPSDWWQWVLLNIIGVIVLAILVGVLIYMFQRNQPTNPRGQGSRSQEPRIAHRSLAERDRGLAVFSWKVARIGSEEIRS